MPAARTVLRVALTAVALVVALVVVGYLTTNLVATASAHGARHRVADAVTERLVTEVPVAQARSEATAGRIDAEPTHTWVSQACEFSSDDAGWMVQNYREVCNAEAVVAWPVDSELEAEALVEGARPPDRSPYRNGSCLSFGMDGDVFGEYQQLLYVAPTGDRYARWCVPDEDGYPARRAVVGELATLDADRGWLLLVTSVPLVDEDIGCVHWSVIFCDNPFGDELAWGEPPAAGTD
jgi:uncharacterized protein YejL (UPF0352 family)